MKTRSWRKACFFKLNEIDVSNSHIVFQEWHEDFAWTGARERLADELQKLAAALDGVARPRCSHRVLPADERLDASLGHHPDRKKGCRGYCAMHRPVTKKSNIFCSHCDVY